MRVKSRSECCSGFFASLFFTSSQPPDFRRCVRGGGTASLGLSGLPWTWPLSGPLSGPLWASLGLSGPPWASLGLRRSAPMASPGLSGPPGASPAFSLSLCGYLFGSLSPSLSVALSTVGSPSLCVWLSPWLSLAVAAYPVPALPLFLWLPVWLSLSGSHCLSVALHGSLLLPLCSI